MCFWFYRDDLYCQVRHILNDDWHTSLSGRIICLYRSVILTAQNVIHPFSIRGKDKFGAKKEKGEVIKNKFTPYDHKVSDKVISICNKNPLTEVQTSLDQIHADVQQLIASVMDQQTETLSLLGKYKVFFCPFETY